MKTLRTLIPMDEDDLINPMDQSASSQSILKMQNAKLSDHENTMSGKSYDTLNVTSKVMRSRSVSQKKLMKGHPSEIENSVAILKRKNR